jgi:HNH endonuclease
MAVSRRLRFEILRRDGYTCRYCGASAPDVTLTVDHVNPSALGGEDRPENLVTACESCNGGKSSIPPDADVVANVAADAVRWSGALRLAADEMLADLGRRNEIRQQFDAAWSGWGLGKGATRQPIPRPDDWALSVDRLAATGLPVAVMLDCVDVAMNSKKVQPENTFRYMCGIAWKKVQQLQEAARESLAPAAGPTSTPDHTRMYVELLGHIFGVLFGVGNQEDATFMALVRGAEMGEDEDPNALDDEGHAACEVINRADGILNDYRSAAKLLLDPLPAGMLDDFSSRAINELNWLPRLREVDRGHLFRDALRARMFLICAQELLNDSAEDSE